MKLNMKMIFIVNESAGRGKSGYDIAFEYKDKEYYNTNKSTIQCKRRIYFHKV